MNMTKKVTGNLRSLENHFRFGENWESFNRTIQPAQYESAVASLRGLLPESLEGSLEGKSFLDIGSGSGLSSYAALSLGAASVDAIDIDPQSVAATKSLLMASSFSNWSVRQESVFDISPDHLYDVVHSWGVLHHTGAVWEALERAAKVVKPAGYLIVALYRKTPLCTFWKWEKRWYAQRAAAGSRRMARAAYVGMASTVMLVTGRNPWRYSREYSEQRGMSWLHDVHDWLGGYPYESLIASDVMERMAALGFTAVQKPAGPSGWVGRLGIGGWIDEFVFRRS
jgi:2-polyprenyl-3-methyl-5-hydroxy-6-metoxy-1,4-benzoquinol methylase